jgi:single-stranded-DNA-specific exonuclease
VADQAAEVIERTYARPDQEPALVVSAADWHPGVIGIVAGRLRERYRRPVVVIGVDQAAAVGKGSGRSQPGVNLGRAIQAAYDAGHLLAGGGHAMAAGLTIKPDRIEGFTAFLGDRLRDETEAATAADVVDIDALVSPAAADRGLYEDFQRLTPFGPGNPEPVFALAGVGVDYVKAMNGGHVRCTLSDGAGGRLKAIAWRSAETDLGRRLLAGGGSLHVAGRLKPDDYMGRQGVQLEIEDAADPRISG